MRIDILRTKNGLAGVVFLTDGVCWTRAAQNHQSRTCRARAAGVWKARKTNFPKRQLQGSAEPGLE